MVPRRLRWSSSVARALVFNERRRMNRLAVRFDLNFTVTIGPQDANRTSVERVDRLRSGMTEQILRTDGNDGYVRRNRVEKRGCRAIGAAVVTDLEHIGVLLRLLPSLRKPRRAVRLFNSEWTTIRLMRKALRLS